MTPHPQRWYDKMLARKAITKAICELKLLAKETVV
jgi:hypothetical protein